MCIPKEGKDKTFFKNWRPITLLNTVYKIASSCIARRVKTVLPQLIHDDQKGFLKGSKHRIHGLLLMIDFGKAFDSVAWSFIEKSLTVFNFGKDI